MSELPLFSRGRHLPLQIVRRYRSYNSPYFASTYSLGSVLAAQLYAAAENELGDLSGDVRDGEFDDLNGWLRESVHQHGKRYTTPDLIEAATGEAFTADYFLEYVEEKYGELYDLE